jgi:hypothetical protein
MNACHRLAHTEAALVIERLGFIICGRSKPEIAEQSEVFSPQRIDPSDSMISAAMEMHAFSPIAARTVLTAQIRVIPLSTRAQTSLCRRGAVHMPCTCAVEGVLFTCAVHAVYMRCRAHRTGVPGSPYRVQITVDWIPTRIATLFCVFSSSVYRFQNEGR